MDEEIQKAIVKATNIASTPHRVIAQEVGVSPLTLSHWRNGRRHPTTENLAALGRILLDQARRLEHASYHLIRLADVAPPEVPEVAELAPALELFKE